MSHSNFGVAEFQGRSAVPQTARKNRSHQTSRMSGRYSILLPGSPAFTNGLKIDLINSGKVIAIW